MKPNPTLTLAWVGIGAAIAGTSCGASFDPYNELKSFRLLAVRAEPPTLAPNATATLDALLYEPDSDVTTYAWSWCPVRSGAEGAYDCAMSEADFKAQLAAAGVPSDSISFDLGSRPTATFTYPLDPAVLAAVCSSPMGPPSGSAAAIINCDQGFPVSVGLTVTHGGKTISGFKTLHLALDTAAHPNANPVMGGLAIAASKGTVSEAQPLEPGDATFTATLTKDYELFADVPETSAETFFGTTTAGIAPTEQREVLFVTWFIEAGSTSDLRTTFYEGTAGFDKLDHNTWTLPQPEEFPRDRARVVLVLRDSRGGVAWLIREVLIAQP